MKIIHVADFHLGAGPIKFETDKKRERKKEIIDNFYRLIMYAKVHDIKTVIIAGDLFDVKEPQIKIANRIKEEIEEAKDISFFYLRGNHDEKVFDDDIIPDNLHLFNSDSFSYFEIGDDVCICGKEIAENGFLQEYDELSLAPSKTNIVVLHGNLIKGTPVLKDDININKLTGKNIDYLALGHIHAGGEGKLDERGQYTYSGCPESRGFDEACILNYDSNGNCTQDIEAMSSKKGFYIYDTISKRKEFVEFGKRRIFNLQIDLTGTTSENDALACIRNIVTSAKENEPYIAAIDIVRITLKGKVDFNYSSLSDRVLNIFGDRFYYFEIKGNLTKFYKADDYILEQSFTGEFIRTVTEKIEDEQERALIIETGLRALKRK